MRNILLAICLVLFAVPAFSQITPDNVLQKQYNYWEQEFNTAILRQWDGNKAFVDIDGNEAGCMTDQFKAELRRRFAENGWELEFTTPVTVGGYLPEECIRIFIRQQKQKLDFTIPVQFTTVSREEYCGYTTREVITIKDAKVWEDVWEKTFKNEEPKPGLQYIYFRREMVIAVYGGQCSTGGHMFEIEKVLETKDTVKVYLKPRKMPIGNGPVTMALTQQYHIIRCRKIDKEVKLMPSILSRGK